MDVQADAGEPLSDALAVCPCPLRAANLLLRQRAHVARLRGLLSSGCPLLAFRIGELRGVVTSMTTEVVERGEQGR